MPDPEILMAIYDTMNELRAHLFTVRRIVLNKGLVTSQEYEDLYLQISASLETPEKQISDLNRLLGLHSSGSPQKPE